MCTYLYLCIWYGSRAAAYLLCPFLIYGRRPQEGDLHVGYTKGLCMQIYETGALEVIADDGKFRWVVACTNNCSQSVMLHIRHSRAACITHIVVIARPNRNSNLPVNCLKRQMLNIRFSNESLALSCKLKRKVNSCSMHSCFICSEYSTRNAHSKMHCSNGHAMLHCHPSTRFSIHSLQIQLTSVPPALSSA